MENAIASSTFLICGTFIVVRGAQLEFELHDKDGNNFTDPAKININRKEVHPVYPEF